MSKYNFSKQELDAAEKRLKQLAKNPRHIHGIYNYCDRWCERCPMTSRCLLFAQENADKAEGSSSHDMENDAFWRGIARNFAVTAHMIRKDAKRLGIDLDTPMPAVQEDRKKRKRRGQKVQTLDTPKMAMGYVKTVDRWFKSHEKQFERKGQELASAALMQIEGDNPEAKAKDITDAVEIVRWYQHQIYVKLMRALGGLKDMADEPEEFREYSLSDANGSAKVSLIGIDRSIEAWARLREHFPDEQDAILDTLVLLDRLRRLIEKIIPGARSFKRPGFDDAESASSKL